ncbi:MAG: ATP-binding protein [Pseudohongiella sp.]|nr:ATP-binding protein [Pseudohongiella sp.]
MSNPKQARLKDIFVDEHEPDSVATLWILRSLVELGGHKTFLKNNCVSDDNLAEFLGLNLSSDLFDAEDESDYDPQTARRQLIRHHQKIEARAEALTLPPQLIANVALIAQLVGLNDAECRILEFCVMQASDPLLDAGTTTIGNLTTNKTILVLARLLRLNEAEVQQALSPKGILQRSGLLSLDQYLLNQLPQKLVLLSAVFADNLLNARTDPLELFKDIIQESPLSKLTDSHYAHIADSFLILDSLLQLALTEKRVGTNILIVGAPGTGKTELARLLAQQVKCKLYEITSASFEGEPITGLKRLSALKAAQSLFSQRPALIVFDEIEDVFGGNAPLLGASSIGQNHKGWINKILEDNPIPTIWISNDASCLDPAFIRRFDLTVEIPNLPRGSRRDFIKRCIPDADAASVERFLDESNLTPALIDDARDLADLLSGNNLDMSRQKLIEVVVNGKLRGQGFKGIPKTSRIKISPLYDARFANTDCDPTLLLNGMRRNGSARLCFYGPPGTGKTALAHWLARELGQPLYQKRASDLMSCFLGGTEQLIAKAFEDAKQDGAILLIDEADSFLQRRDHAHHSWEITQVNELLTQLEDYEGIVVMCTNFASSLDTAAARRFDMRIKFDYLHTAQAWELLQLHCRTLQLAEPSDNDWMDFALLQNLTPGDFNTILRRHNITPFATAAELVAGLKARPGQQPIQIA